MIDEKTPQGDTNDASTNYAGHVEYIKKHIEMDLGFQPQTKKGLAKILLQLFKLSKDDGENYIFQPVMLLSQLEENPLLKKLVGRDIIFLHESKKAAMLFKDLKGNEREEIEKYIQDMIGHEDHQTLEQYMSEKFELKTEYSYDVDSQHCKQGKLLMSSLATMNAGNFEDFTLRIPEGQEKNFDEITNIICEYYKDRGYAPAIIDGPNYIKAIKEDEELLISFSNFSYSYNKIMVSVLKV